MVKKNSIALLALSFAIIFALTFNVLATGTFLACLRDNEIIRFSECNPNMDNYRCTSTTCQICVNDIGNGVYCQANPNACNEACVYIYDAPDEPPVIIDNSGDAPTIDLVSPAESYNAKAGQLEFKFMITRNNTSQSLKNCDLILNNNVVASKKTSIKYSPTSNSILYSVIDGSYSWRVECELWETDKNGISRKTGTVDSSSRQFTIGEAPVVQSSITLAGPEDNYTVTGEQQIQFNFNVTAGNLSEVTGCSLVLDGTKTSMGLSQISPQNSYSSNVAVGTHIWSVECMIGNSTVFNSEVSRNIIVNQVPSSGGSGGGSGGGGGGSSGSIAPTYTVSSQNLSEGVDKTLIRGARIKFLILNQTHYIRVDSITSTSAKITVMSMPKTFVMQKGEEKKVDVDDDGIEDISIILKDIPAGKAEIVVKSLSSESSGSTETTDEDSLGTNNSGNETQTENTTSQPQGSGEAITGASIASRIRNLPRAYQIIITILVVLCVLIAIASFSGKKKKEEKSSE